MIRFIVQPPFTPGETPPAQICFHARFRRLARPRAEGRFCRGVGPESALARLIAQDVLDGSRVTERKQWDDGNNYLVDGG
jgi:hypothetical protein